MKLKNRNGLLTVSEIAHESGVLPSTIRYYSNIGLLKVTQYSTGGFRLFARDETLKQIKKIKEIIGRRVTLEEVKKKINADYAENPQRTQKITASNSPRNPR